MNQAATRRFPFHTCRPLSSKVLIFGAHFPLENCDAKYENIKSATPAMVAFGAATAASHVLMPEMAQLEAIEK